MKLDFRLFTGILIGMVIALHYSGILAAYLPVMMVAALILVLNLVHR